MYVTSRRSMKLSRNVFASHDVFASDGLTVVRLLAERNVDGVDYDVGSEIAMAHSSALALIRRGLAEGVVLPPISGPPINSAGRVLRRGNR